jgi:hypothetical protein
LFFPPEAVEVCFLNCASADWPSIFLLPSTLMTNKGKGIVSNQRVKSTKINLGDTPGFLNTTNNQHYSSSYNKLREIARQVKKTFACYAKNFLSAITG